MTSLSEADAPAPIGHNQPPEPTLPEKLAETYSLEIGRAEPIAALANGLPKELASTDDKAKAGDIARDAADLAKALDKLREVEKAPFLLGGRQVDGHFNPTIQRLERISDAMLERIRIFNRALQAKADLDRAKAEIAERERADQARQAAAEAAKAGRQEDAIEELKDAAAAETRADDIALAPPLPREEFKTTTAAGTAIGTRKEWTFDVADYSKVDLNALRPFIKREEVDKALRQHVRTYKGGTPVEGVRFFEDDKATVRR